MFFRDPFVFGNFDIRKTILQFDDVMSDQRRVIYEQRLDVMKTENIYSIVDNIFKEIIDNILVQSAHLEEDNERKENTQSIDEIQLKLILTFC